jgi:hypothetical protein
MPTVRRLMQPLAPAALAEPYEIGGTSALPNSALVLNFLFLGLIKGAATSSVVAAPERLRLQTRGSGATTHRARRRLHRTASR